MSYTAAVFGNVRFKKEVEEGERTRLLAQMEDLLECSGKPWGEHVDYLFKDLSMSCHIHMTDVERFYQENKESFEEFGVDLFNLDEPDEKIYFDGEDEEISIY